LSDENFPVGSWLLPARLRPHVATFYALARTTDDIADNPALSAADKLARLDAFDQALHGNREGDPALAKSYRMRESLAATGVTAKHSSDLITAFKQDATKLRYTDWNDLIGYCNLSAAPVGRYLLDLHGEDRAGYAASDPLCNALQILNHLQDCKKDYLDLDRVYLPGDWLGDQKSTVEDLKRDAATPGVRAVIDLCLDGCEELMAKARTLPGRLRDRRLAMESAVIVRLADRLIEILRAGDPIAGRVALTKGDFLGCGIRGVVAGLFLDRIARRP
jgi:squalene synthase HpnC